MDKKIETAEDLLNKAQLKEVLGLTQEELEGLPETPEKHYSKAVIGTAGHVDHGKSTLTQSLTGKLTMEHSEELRRGITIKLGYSHLDLMVCPSTWALVSNVDPTCSNGEAPRHVRCYSILDHPGHEILVSRMLTGSSVIDYGLVVIAANEPCPQPQTSEHVAALEAMGIEDIIVVQNKIELVSEEEAFKNYEQIVDFFKEETTYEDPPIIPVSAALNINLDLLKAAILKHFKPLPIEEDSDPYFHITRSFDANKPGKALNELTGGIVGGVLKRGALREGEEVEIRPGYEGDKDTSVLRSTVTSIFSGGTRVEVGKKHSLLGVGTKLDPSLTKSDGLAGNLMGKPGTLPPLVKNVEITNLHKLAWVVGARKRMENPPFRRGDRLLLCAGTAMRIGKVTSATEESLEMILPKPMSLPKGQRAALTRRIKHEFRLVAYGELNY